MGLTWFENVCGCSLVAGGNSKIMAGKGEKLDHKKHLDELKGSLKTKVNGPKEAFEKLGGGGDGMIDQSEFSTFLRDELGYDDDGLIDRLFALIDHDGTGQITQAKFKNIFSSHDMIKELTIVLKGKDKHGPSVFNRIGGGDDGKIDRGEFREFLRTELGYPNVEANDRLFDLLDADGNGFITKDEFMTVWGVEKGETSQKAPAAPKAKLGRRKSQTGLENGDAAAAATEDAVAAKPKMKKGKTQDYSSKGSKK